MELVDRILRHQKYIEYIELNAIEEKQRELCHHDLQHFLDVARVAYLISFERGFGLDKETIYITALLHDIAKWKQYREKVDHAAEGAILAEEILRDIGVNEPESEIILDAIRSHRTKGKKSSLLSEVLYTADKSCRLCVQCKAIEECNRFQHGEHPVVTY